MKNKFSFLLFSLMVLMAISCEKQEDVIYYEGGTEPIFTASSTAPMVLTKSNENNIAMRFNWTNPNYMTTTGISSHDVIYYLQADTTGSGFTNPNMAQVSISKDLSKEFTVKEFNKLFGATQLKLLENIPHNIEFRIKATLVGSAVPLYSNIIKMTVTPYLDVAVAIPTTGRLFLVGDATPGAWSNPVPLPSQEFTKINNTTYQITIPLVANKHYLFLPLNGDWSNKYAVHDGNTQPRGGGEFGYNGSNSFYNADMPGPASDGTYRITVDFIAGTYTVVKI